MNYRALAQYGWVGKGAPVLPSETPQDVAPVYEFVKYSLWVISMLVVTYFIIRTMHALRDQKYQEAMLNSIGIFIVTVAMTVRFWR